jgi:hypothetical protein
MLWWLLNITYQIETFLGNLIDELVGQANHFRDLELQILKWFLIDIYLLLQEVNMLLDSHGLRRQSYFLTKLKFLESYAIFWWILIIIIGG